MKQASEIYNEMLSVFQRKTGFSVGEQADMAVRLYAAAAELESLYSYCDWALNQSFPQTATGEYLDLHAGLRGLARKQAQTAKGVLEFSLQTERSENVTVPAGTVCTDGGLIRFVTTEEGLIPAGEVSCQVQAVAEIAGESGNASAHTVTRMPQPPVGISVCTNPQAFSGGADTEEDETLRNRVLMSFSRLPNGANAAFYEERAASDPDVAGVQVLPRVRGTGTVDVVISSAGGVPSAQVVDRVQADLQAVREICVDVLVRAPETRAVDVSVTVWPNDGVSGQEACLAAERAIYSVFGGGLLGKPVYLAQLADAIYATGKVKNYVITAPTEDVGARDGVLPILGALAVTEGD